MLGLVGPVSVYCDWVRWKVWSATSISVWQHVKLSRSVPEIHSHVAGTLSSQQQPQPTQQTQNPYPVLSRSSPNTPPTPCPIPKRVRTEVLYIWVRSPCQTCSAIFRVYRGREGGGVRGRDQVCKYFELFLHMEGPQGLVALHFEVSPRSCVDSRLKDGCLQSVIMCL